MAKQMGEKTYDLSIKYGSLETIGLELPELQGTIKQNRWAEQIRESFLHKLNNFDDYEGKSWETENFGQAIQNMLINYPVSKYWIENLQNYDRQKATAKVMEFYKGGDITEQANEGPAKGLLTELIAVKRETDGTCTITGSKKGKTTNGLRKEMQNNAFPGEILVNFNTDVYAFTYNANLGENIRWVGNYKQNIWSNNVSEEQKAALGGENKLPEPDQSKGEIFHEQYSKILACVQQDIPVYLVGPAGSGKNHTLEQIARELNLKFYFTNSIQQEHKLTGFIDAGGRYHETEFYKAFTNGGLFFLDEMDASIPEVLVLLNAAIANGYFEFPNGRAEAHIEFRVVAAGNTMGSGADDQYTGRLVLDQATLDRFAIIQFDYDIRVELKLAKGNLELVNFIRDLRKQSEMLGIRATYSYRAIQAATKLETLLSVEDIVMIAIVKGIDKDTVKTYKTDDSNRYSMALKKLQRAA